MVQSRGLEIRRWKQSCDLPWLSAGGAPSHDHHLLSLVEGVTIFEAHELCSHSNMALRMNLR